MVVVVGVVVVVGAVVVVGVVVVVCVVVVVTDWAVGGGESTKTGEVATDAVLPTLSVPVSV